MTTATPPAPRTFTDGRDGVPLALAEEHAGRAYDHPRAFLFDLFGDDVPTGFRREGDVAVVDIRGPLEQRGGWFWDGYDSVTDRVKAALSDVDVRAVVLSIDSPGGVAAGCFDAARAIRSAVDTSGKPLVAHADTWATSAAYAVAVAADHVCVTRDGALGSVGVIATVIDRTKMTEGLGLDVRVVRSGPLKADPHPDVPLTDASVKRVQARINDLAASFAEWVGERRGQAAEQVLAHKGATVFAAAAVEAGLADSIGTIADAITTARGMADANDTKRKTMDENARMTAQLASLRAAAGVESDAELTAALGTLKKRAEVADAHAAEVARLKGEIAARDARDQAAARDAVLAKHRVRGALTPAMEADAEYMADLAPLAPVALDRILARLQGAAPAAVPRKVESVDPAAPVDAPAAATRADREWQKVTGVSDAGLKLAIEDEDRRRRARAEDDAA